MARANSRVSLGDKRSEEFFREPLDEPNVEWVCCFQIDCVNRRQGISTCNYFIELTVHKVPQPVSILHRHSSCHENAIILFEGNIRISVAMGFHSNTTKLASNYKSISCFQIMHNTHSGWITLKTVSVFKIFQLLAFVWKYIAQIIQ